MQCSYSDRAVHCGEVWYNAVWSIVQCSDFSIPAIALITHCPPYLTCPVSMSWTTLPCTAHCQMYTVNETVYDLYFTGQHLRAAPFHPIWCFYCSQTVRSLLNPLFPGHSLSNTLTFGGNKVISIFTWTRQTKTKPCAHSTLCSFYKHLCSSLTHRLSDPLWKYLHSLSQTVRAKKFFKEMFTPHYVSHVTCQVSGVPCHVSHVTCLVSNFGCYVIFGAKWLR